MNKSTKGFTIVELLVVIIVIAILSVIGSVSYAGMQSRAYDAAVQADVNSLSKKLHLFEVEYGRYPSSEDELAKLGVVVDPASYAAQDNFLVYTVQPHNGLGHVRVAGLSRSGNVYGVNITAGFYWQDDSCTDGDTPLPYGSVGRSFCTTWSAGMSAYDINNALGGSCTLSVHVFISNDGKVCRDIGDGNACLL